MSGRPASTSFCTRLRAACRPLHDGLDRQPAIASLASPTPRADHYRALLQAMLGVVPPLERALSASLPSHGLNDWLPALNRSTALATDCAALTPEVRPIPAPVPRLPSAEHCLAALYLIEGSRLGGQVMARNLSRHADTRALPTHFLRAPAPPPLSWPHLLETLARYPGDTPEASAASEWAAEALRRLVGALARVEDREVAA